MGVRVMANGGKVALAVGAGYLLGRTRKMRVALMLAAAGITGKFPGSPTQLVAHGLKSLGASADVSQLSQQLRGELLDAARAAALAAATPSATLSIGRVSQCVRLPGLGGADGAETMRTAIRTTTPTRTTSPWMSMRKTSMKTRNRTTTTSTRTTWKRNPRTMNRRRPGHDDARRDKTPPRRPLVRRGVGPQQQRPSGHQCGEDGETNDAVKQRRTPEVESRHPKERAAGVSAEAGGNVHRTGDELRIDPPQRGK